MDQSVHTTGIFVRRTLEDFSLPDYCLGPPVSDVRLYSPKRRTFALSSPNEEYRVGKMGALYNHILSAGMDAGVQFDADTSFRGAEPVSGGSHIELETAGRQRTITARYLIGADGANSPVARATGLSQNREWIVGVEEVYDSQQVDAPPCLHCFLDPKLAPGYIAWIAHDGEEMHVGVGGYGNRFDPNACLATFLDEVNDFVPFGNAELIERRGGRIPVGGLLRNIVNERAILVGDAAGAVSPLTAGGLDPCLRQSALAVEVASAFLNTNDSEVLKRYDSTPFRKRFRKRSLLRRGLAAMRSRWMAEVGFAALQLPPFKSLAQRIFFGRGSFPLEPKQLETLADVRTL